MLIFTASVRLSNLTEEKYYLTEKYNMNIIVYYEINDNICSKLSLRGVYLDVL